MLADELISAAAEPFLVAAIHEAITALGVHVTDRRWDGIDDDLQLRFARPQARFELVLRAHVDVHTSEADNVAFGIAERRGVLSNPRLGLARRAFDAERDR